MESGIWALVGVVVGSMLTGLLNLVQQRRAFEHEKSMYLLRNSGTEMVKQLLTAMLEHRRFVERSFAALRQPIGGYSDDQVRQLLHEVGARRRTREDGSEWWYLVSREDERLERLRSGNAAHQGETAGD